MTASSPEELAKHIIRVLRDHQHKAYLVGGCVRDRLLHLVPKDYDVSTDATPDQLCTYFPHAQTVGAHFGVVLVHDEYGIQVEVATFRSEGAYTDGRRPTQVRFETDPALDAKRRDFSINGLMEDPFSGEVLDYVQGRPDLAERVVRAIGDPVERFEEDHLRMLRAVRFAARLGFSIAPQTLDAISQLAPSITKISAERIRDELIRIMTEGGARRGLELLDQSGLLQQILPEVKAFQGVPQPPEFHPEGDVWTHVLLMLDSLQAPSATLAFAVLLHDVGKPPTFRRADRIRFDGHAEVGARMARVILNRLKFSNEAIEQITSLVANHMKFKDVQQMRTSTLKRFLRLPEFEEHLRLHRLDCLASNGRTDAYRFVREKQQEFSQEGLRPVRLLNGHDLIRAGYKPGPLFARALESIETAQLEGEIHTSEEAMHLAERILSANSELAMGVQQELS
jgi:putative nucleotidyltransferase with HDIG domain